MTTRYIRLGYDLVLCDILRIWGLIKVNVKICSYINMYLHGGMITNIFCFADLFEIANMQALST